MNHHHSGVATTLRHLAQKALAAVVLSSTVLAPAWAIKLADQPIFSTSTVPGNVMLTLSVEYPTPNSAAYTASSFDDTSVPGLVGYFDKKKCYAYKVDPDATLSTLGSDTVNSHTNNSYFYPISLADSNYRCSGSLRWSGRYLNWAVMHTIDPFRQSLTGGYRIIDETARTVLSKAYSEHSGMPDRALSTNVSTNTPFSWGQINSRTQSLGVLLYVSSSNNTMASNIVMYNPANSVDQSHTYALSGKVLVCDSTVSVEDNCTQYGSNYKPEGLMQKYATKLRFGVMSYLNDNSSGRDGGVLRAQMKFVGPYLADGTTDNPAKEWDATTGVFVTNPDTSDATNSSVTDSGAANYLNKFGSLSHTYKTYDNVSELYYSAIRYFKNLGNVTEYSNSLTTAMKDKFPVITSWNDPIQYQCQKNFIIGIGDINTWYDADLPGSTIGVVEPTKPAAVTADTTVDVRDATNKVGVLEGNSTSLGTAYVASSRGDTYFIAGLAYASHVKDMRPGEFCNTGSSGTACAKDNIQTVATYWLDVQENQVYTYRNQYWLAAKYGGFPLPSGYSYDTGTAAQIAASDWHSKNNVDPASSTRYLPDNYFLAGQADKMQSGLSSAFSDITSKVVQSTGNLGLVNPNLNKSAETYAVGYNASRWSGSLAATKLDPTVTYTAANTPAAVWDAKNKLTTQAAGTGYNSGRVIVTRSGGAFVPFRVATSTSGSGLSSTDLAALDITPTITGGSSTTTTKTNYLNYLRGDRTNEVGNSVTGGTSTYRQRDSVLGDIVNSKAVPSAPPSRTYTDDFNPGYSTYVSDNASRLTMVMVGANDGMFHAFNGTVDTASASGTEIFAYVPSFVYQGPNSTPTTDGLAAYGKATSFVHHYYVDGRIAVGDVDLGKVGGTTGTVDWATIAVGGMGKGGKGYFAVDISDPTSFGTEAAAKNNMLWEFTDSNMGYSYGQAQVFKTAKWGWVVAFSSGYSTTDTTNSTAGYVYFLNAKTGALLEKVSIVDSARPGVSAGLGPISAYTPNQHDYTADSVYVGDLNGNVWRIDLTSATAAYTALHFATLTNAAGTRLPITTAPYITSVPNTLRRFVLVGTGKLLDTTDITSTTLNAFYVMADGTNAAFYTTSTLPSGYSFPITRSQLNADSNLLTGIGSTPTSTIGYYLDMPAVSNAAWQLNVGVAANYGILGFGANLPNGDVCNPSGTNQTYALDITSGKTVLTDSNGNLVSSISGTGTITDVRFVMNADGTISIITSNDSGQLTSTATKPGNSTTTLQLNWREVPIQ